MVKLEITIEGCLFFESLFIGKGGIVMGLISYCPRCGRLYRGKKPGLHAENEKCDCKRKIPFYNLKEKRKASLIKTDIESEKWENKYECDPVDVMGNPESLYRFMWEKYIDVPENKHISEEAFKKYKKEMELFFKNGGHDRRFRTAAAITNGPKCKCKWG